MTTGRDPPLLLGRSLYEICDMFRYTCRIHVSYTGNNGNTEIGSQALLSNVLGGSTPEPSGP